MRDLDEWRYSQVCVVILSCMTCVGSADNEILRIGSMENMACAFEATPPVYAFGKSASTAATGNAAPPPNLTLVIGLGFLKTGSSRLARCLQHYNRQRNASQLAWCSPPKKELRFWHSKQVQACTQPVNSSLSSPSSSQKEAQPLLSAALHDQVKLPLVPACSVTALQDIRDNYIEALTATTAPTLEAFPTCGVAWEFTPGTLQVSSVRRICAPCCSRRHGRCSAIQSYR